MFVKRSACPPHTKEMQIEARHQYLSHVPGSNTWPIKPADPPQSDNYSHQLHPPPPLQLQPLKLTHSNKLLLDHNTTTKAPLSITESVVFVLRLLIVTQQPHSMPSSGKTYLKIVLMSGMGMHGMIFSLEQHEHRSRGPVTHTKNMVWSFWEANWSAFNYVEKQSDIKAGMQGVNRFFSSN